MQREAATPQPLYQQPERDVKGIKKRAERQPTDICKQYIVLDPSHEAPLSWRLEKGNFDTPTYTSLSRSHTEKHSFE